MTMSVEEVIEEILWDNLDADRGYVEGISKCVELIVKLVISDHYDVSEAHYGDDVHHAERSKVKLPEAEQQSWEESFGTYLKLKSKGEEQ